VGVVVARAIVAWPFVAMAAPWVEMVLIAYHLLESSIGVYIERLVNKLMMTANKS
jgi:hypothetical protein